MQQIKAIIPLKRHSERLERKNTRLMCGRPLFHWIFIALSKSKLIHEIIIDTDCEEIAKDAKDHFDVTVLMRPLRLRGHMVGIVPLIEFELSQIIGENFLQTHATNPLLKTETIDSAIEAFFNQDKHDALFSVTQVQSRFFWGDGRPINHDINNMLRTQDMEPIFEENSNLYLFKRETFNKHKRRTGANPMLFPIDRLEAVDIDDRASFDLAEHIMKTRMG